MQSIPYCYINQEMCDKTVDNYFHALEFVSECFRTQNMCDKAVNKSFFVFHSVCGQYKTQEKYDTVLIVYKWWVLKTFYEECVGSIQSGTIVTYWRIRTFLLKNCT